MNKKNYITELRHRVKITYNPTTFKLFTYYNNQW